MKVGERNDVIKIVVVCMENLDNLDRYWECVNNGSWCWVDMEVEKELKIIFRCLIYLFLMN